MEEKFNDILEKDEKITKVFKPNKTKFWWSTNLLTIASVIGIPLWPFVWLFARIYYKNRFYCYTNKRIIIRGGIIGVDYKSLEFKHLTATIVYVSPLDKIVRKNTGSIMFGSPSSPIGNPLEKTNPYTFRHVEKPYDVMREMKESMEDKL